jgi:hypothetical protein
MARKDMQLDEGVTFGRRRTSTPTTPATASEVQAAIDAASEELGVDRAIPGEAATNLFAPIGGGPTPGDASVADQEMFISEGYNTGTLPPKYQTLFGNDPKVIGWKETTNSDGSKNITVAKEQGDADGGLQFQTYGASFRTDNSGNVNPSSSTTSTTNTDNNSISAALQLQINNLIEQGRVAEARRLEDKARFDAEIKAQAAASKLAYDTAAKDKADAIKVERVSAYQTLKTEFEKYGLGSLVESVEALILNGTPKSEATLKLRATPQYQLRFAGNTNRLAAGKNLYDESTYLALENDFQTSFEAYGQKSLLGNTRESAQAMFAEYIGSDKSPTEIKDRIRLAVDEVSNRKDIRAEFQKFFPEITDSDLVSYFLKPKETLSTLNAKVRVAQIGSAASAQGLNASLTTATDLEQLGLTEQQARTGYQRVATDLPTIEKLGDIDKTDISQTTAENAYLKGLASEQRKIDKAAERERNRYAQSSGMNKVSLTDVKPAGQY